MKKIFILIYLFSATILFGVCSSKEPISTKNKVNISTGQVNKNIVIGKKLPDYTLSDQYEKRHTLTTSTKKVIFVFTKEASEIVREFLDVKSKSFLEDNGIDFVADISGMPTTVFYLFAIPDFKKSQYPILLMQDKKKASVYKHSINKNTIMLITLEKKIVKNVKLITNKTDLNNEIKSNKENKQ